MSFNSRDSKNKECRDNGDKLMRPPLPPAWRSAYPIPTTNEIREWCVAGGCGKRYELPMIDGGFTFSSFSNFYNSVGGNSTSSYQTFK